MRYGFTTGSCSAAAAKAAAYMLLSGREKQEIDIETPKGITFHAQLEDICRSEQAVSCAVRKDGGDDPDITTGMLIYAKVMIYSGISKNAASEKETVNLNNETNEWMTEKSVLPAGKKTGRLNEENLRKTQFEADSEPAALQNDMVEYMKPTPEVIITGGIGVGLVTKPGLDQPVGNAAINSVPRRMIEKEVREVMELFDYRQDILVEISVPGGEELAKKTFNPRLGIVGGISILGTSGIVEPMSSKALLDTIRVELNQKRALGNRIAAVSPGNYGLDFMKETFGYDLDRSVKCSNFIGDTIDMAAELGFESMLLTGHIGKLIKVSGGILNTHSKEGDCRMELLAAAAIRAGASAETALQLLEAVTTEEGIRIIIEAGILQEAMRIVMERIMFFLERRAAGRLHIECMVYCKEFGLLGSSAGAEEMLGSIMKRRIT